MWLVILFIAVTIIFILWEYLFSCRLYNTPKNENYFNNVKNIRLENLKDITPSPKYVLTHIIINAVAIGIFFVICDAFEVSIAIPTIYSIILILLYIAELSKSISLNENTLILSRMFSKDICIPVTTIEGMYLYNSNKKFIKKHNHITKLVITACGKKYKYTPSSLENQVILNMMKFNFGISDYKIFVGNKK